MGDFNTPVIKKILFLWFGWIEQINWLKGINHLFDLACKTLQDFHRAGVPRVFGMQYLEPDISFSPRKVSVTLSLQSSKAIKIVFSEVSFEIFIQENFRLSQGCVS